MRNLPTITKIFLIFTFSLFLTNNCLAQVVVKFSSNNIANISFDKGKDHSLPYTTEFNVNTDQEIDDLSGHTFRLTMMANNVLETIYGQILIHRETDYTKVATVELTITEEILHKVKNGEVPIITIRDPSEQEAIILKAVFGNRELKKDEPLSTSRDNRLVTVLVIGAVTVLGVIAYFLSN